MCVPLIAPPKVCEMGDRACLAFSAPMQGMTARLLRSGDRPELIEASAHEANADRFTQVEDLVLWRRMS